MKERASECDIYEFLGEHHPAIGHCEWARLHTEGQGFYNRIVENTPEYTDQLHRMIERGEAEITGQANLPIVVLHREAL